ncbi:fungal-specific transcription factor domain-containing protein [Dactylonectria estremocensis]|uniref:Fungal-specific transcription factor domain-containing protein n=1 Tax=Dactylonectria estremocensis TaxID=1079267 RepID=A0A9P9D5K6_9HYPO|nr:fungal-specific transcription factor domain-containing protein [Dactylonectria estremocensis]
MFSVRLHNPNLGTPLQPAPGPACDQCRRSKAKCNRQRPCLTCTRRHITCCYDAIPKARGRRARTRSWVAPSDSRGSASTPDVMAWETDASRETEASREIDASPSTRDAGLEAIGGASPTPQPRPLTERLDPIPVQVMNPEYVDDCSISLGFGEADTSSDDTSPIERPLTTESYPREDIFTPEHLGLDEPDSGVWPISDGVADYLRSSLLVLSRSGFLPYVHIFFQRLYPVFPVVDKEGLLTVLQSNEHQEQPLSVGLYSFLTALSAAVIVQLNIAEIGTSEAQSTAFNDSDNGSQLHPEFRSAFSAQFLIAQCMLARQQQNFIEEPDEWTVLTSFFLFAYHGNLDQSRSAWYYLREAIGFIQELGLDQTDTYASLDTETAQRRCRIFWLVFITERAYAIQHRRRAVLEPTIELPRVFESQDPKLAYGFVTLARVFAAVDGPLIVAWSDQPPPGTVGTAQKASQAIARFLRHNDVEGVTSEIEETQRLDILVTHYWLRILVCQLRMGYTAQSIASTQRTTWNCVLNTSRSLLQMISSASPKCLESHGIGMEQKVSDVASCLCDILASLNTDQFSTEFFSAPDVLNNFMVFLAGFRNHESQYLRPLAQKAATVLAARLHPSFLLTSAEDRMTDQEILSYEDESVWTQI